MFSGDFSMTSDLSRLSSLINSGKIYTGKALNQYVNIQRENYAKRVRNIIQEGDENGTDEFSFGNKRVSREWLENFRKLPRPEQEVIIKNLSQEKFLSDYERYFNRITDATFLKNSIGEAFNKYDTNTLTKINADYSVLDKFNSLLHVKPTNNVITDQMDFLRPIPNPIEVKTSENNQGDIGNHLKEDFENLETSPLPRFSNDDSLFKNSIGELKTPLNLTKRHINPVNDPISLNKQHYPSLNNENFIDDIKHDKALQLKSIFIDSVQEISYLIEDIVKFVEMNDVLFKNTKYQAQLTHFIEYIIKYRKDDLKICNQKDSQHYGIIFTVSKLNGQLSSTEESLFEMALNISNVVLKQLPKVNEIANLVQKSDYETQMSQYYNKVASLSLSDIIEVNVFPHLKHLVQNYNDFYKSQDLDNIVFRSISHYSLNFKKIQMERSNPFLFLKTEVAILEKYVDKESLSIYTYVADGKIRNIRQYFVSLIYECDKITKFLYENFLYRVLTDPMEKNNSYKQILFQICKKASFRIQNAYFEEIIDDLYKNNNFQANDLKFSDQDLVVRIVIAAFYKEAAFVPFITNVPLEIVRQMTVFKNYFEYFKNVWLNAHDETHIATRTLARYFALIWLYIFYTYDVNVRTGARIADSIDDNIRKQTIGDIDLRTYIVYFTKNYLQKNFSKIKIDMQEVTLDTFNEEMNVLQSEYRNFKTRYGKRITKTISLIDYPYSDNVTSDDALDEENMFKYETIPMNGIEKHEEENLAADEIELIQSDNINEQNVYSLENAQIFQKELANLVEDTMLNTNTKLVKPKKKYNTRYRKRTERQKSHSVIPRRAMEKKTLITIPNVQSNVSSNTWESNDFISKNHANVNNSVSSFVENADLDNAVNIDNDELDDYYDSMTDEEY